MSTFAELLQLAGSEEPGALFTRAWQLWGSVQRTIQPESSETELRSAQALVSILIDANALNEKQLKQANLCNSSVCALLATLEPAASLQPTSAAMPAPPLGDSSPTTSAARPHAGLRHAPRPDALPSPSMLLGSSLLSAKAGTPSKSPAPPSRPAALAPIAAENSGSSGGEVGFTSQSPPTAHPPTSSPAPTAAAPAPAPPQPSPPPAALTAAAFGGALLSELKQRVEAAPVEHQRQLVGEWTYAAVVQLPGVPDPAKITGMLIDLPLEQVLPLLAEPTQLAQAVAQAVAALRAAEAPPPVHAAAASGPGGASCAAAPAAAATKEPGWVQRDVLSRPKPPPKPLPSNAKTRLCKYWVQRGHCMQGDKCNFAHGMPDMAEVAQQRVVTKVEAGIAKKGAPPASLGFMPMQARDAAKEGEAQLDPASNLAQQPVPLFHIVPLHPMAHLGSPGCKRRLRCREASAALPKWWTARANSKPVCPILPHPETVPVYPPGVKAPCGDAWPRCLAPSGSPGQHAPSGHPSSFPSPLSQHRLRPTRLPNPALPSRLRLCRRWCDDQRRRRPRSSLPRPHRRLPTCRPPLNRPQWPLPPRQVRSRAPPRPRPPPRWPPPSPPRSLHMPPVRPLPPPRC